MQNTKKLLYSLYAASAVLGASLLSGCQTTRYVYLNADGTPAYVPSPSYTPTSTQSFKSNAGSVISGILQGVGQGLSAL